MHKRVFELTCNISEIGITWAGHFLGCRKIIEAGTYFDSKSNAVLTIRYHCQGWLYGTVRYVGTVWCASTFGKKYGTLVRYALFLMVRVHYVGPARLSCNGTGTVRWYAV